jgi:threonine synthase
VIDAPERTSTRLDCSACHRSFPLWERRWRCDCGAPLIWNGGTGTPAPPGAGVWRHASLLPPVDEAARVTLGEGDTPLLSSGHKLEHLSPTGSFKDRGACVVASCLVQMGVTRAVVDSSGNAGAAMAAYLAAAGISCVVFAPADASPAKLRQIAAYGARLELVEGARAEVTRRAQAWAQDTGDHYASHLWSPFFSAGLRTIAVELAHAGALGGVIAPVGSGSLLIGLHAGFSLLRAAGRIESVPPLYGVQAETCDPLAAALEGRDPICSGETIAEGIRIAAPPRAAEVLRAVRESGGAMATVGESEIAEARASLARRGVLVEPTAAVGEAGRRKLAPDTHSVVILTGSGLKALA